MRAMRAWPVLLAVALAGCGGGTAAAPTVTAPEPSTTAAAASTTASTSAAQLTTGQPPVTTAQRPELTFPATTPAEVLALAGQRPTGVADYQVTITGTDAAGSATGTATTATDTAGTGTTGTDTTGTTGTEATPGVTYTVELASDDNRARIHQTQQDGQTWIGLDLAGNRVTYTCTEPAGQALTCKSGDPDGAGARAALEISRVLGNAFVAQVFSPIAAQGSGVSVAGDSQAGVPVSCMAAAPGRLCVSRSGFMTEISTAGVSALAQRVTTDVTTADLDPPQQP
jgi:hypothetical protein